MYRLIKQSFSRFIDAFSKIRRLVGTQFPPWTEGTDVSAVLQIREENKRGILKFRKKMTGVGCATSSPS